MQNAANTAPEKGEARKRNLRERAVGELEKYATITVYLWLLFALFSLHTRQGAAAARDDQRLAAWLRFGKRPDLRQNHPDRPSAGSRKESGEASAAMDRARQVANLRDPAHRVSHR